MAEQHGHANPAGASGEAPESLAEARREVQTCRRCDLYRDATQAVFGAGAARAALMLVGEQPGDQEDLQGLPFVGPAGRVLEGALQEAGIAREDIYLTNAVKHFKFAPRGKNRLHQKPNAGEIQACRFWLGLELRFVRPKVVVALGATALRALLERNATISSLRGTPMALENGTKLIATIHPSFLLRMPHRERAEAERQRFIEDLTAARKLALH